MKKLISTSIFFFLINLSFSQITPGRYLIRLSENNKSVYSYQNNTITLQETSDQSLDSQDFLWDVKTVRNQPGCFLIQKVKTLKCITFKSNSPKELVEKETYMEAQMPLANNWNQTFRINSVGNGNYTIQPGNSKDNEAYFAAKMSTMNVNNGDLQFEYKNQASNPSTYSNTSNIYFNFLKTASTSTAVVSTVVKPIVSPSVYVTPKSDNKITIDFKTGTDNLDHREYQTNVDVKITFNGKPDLLFENVNKNQNWPSNSVRRFTADLPVDIKVHDIKTISVIRGNAIGRWNNIDGAMADNWDLDKLTVGATIMESGISKRYVLADLKGSGGALYRFVYENRNQCANCGNAFSFTFLHQYNTSTPSAITATAMPAKLTYTIGTGGDNLEGGNNNVKITIRMKKSPKVYVLNNINGSRKWDNFTEKTRIMDIINSTDMNINDIKEIEIRHTGGGGIGADNWDVDKIYITIAKDGTERILVDKVGVPIQRFTGDNRALVVKF